MDQSAQQKEIESTETRELLSRLKREAFDGSDEELATALGRPEAKF